MNQAHGKLTTWKSDRGFGFIRPDGGGKDVFVHIRDFGNISRDPRVGDNISYVPMKDDAGKLRAADVHIEGVTRAPLKAPVRSRGNRSKKPSYSVGTLLVTSLFGGLLILSYLWENTSEPAPANTVTRPANPTTKSPRFQCTGKQYCSQMRSCAEAKFYLRSCPNTKMDGDRDGIPCESQWC